MTSTPSPSSPATESADDTEVMRLWRECGLPEYFLGNGGTNHKLVAFAKACRRPPVSSPAGEREKNMGVAAGAAPLEHEPTTPPALSDDPQGHDAPCYYCGEPCDAYAGNPSKWPIPLCHSDDPGVTKWHHIGCVSARLIENQPTSAWRDIASAPKDGTAFQARIPGHGDDNVIAWADGLLDSAGNDCGGWYFVEDQEPPSDWTDGICWTVNEDGVASTPPTHWKPLPPNKAVAEVAAEEQVRSPSSGEPVHSSSIRSEALEEAAKRLEVRRQIFLERGDDRGAAMAATVDEDIKAIRALKEGK